MAIFATMVSLRNWVGGEIVQARGKPRGTKTLRWTFLKERTMKPHHKLFFFLLFLPELVSFNTVFAVLTECFEKVVFFFVGPTNAGIYYRKQEGKPTNRNCVWGMISGLETCISWFQQWISGVKLCWIAWLLSRPPTPTQNTTLAASTFFGVPRSSPLLQDVLFKLVIKISHWLSE